MPRANCKKGIDLSDWQKTTACEITQRGGRRLCDDQSRCRPQSDRPDSSSATSRSATALGSPCGVYWFSYAYTEELAHNEAKYCLEAIAPYKVDYPVAYDFEYDSVDNAEKLGIDRSTKEMASRLRPRIPSGKSTAARLLRACSIPTPTISRGTSITELAETV